MRIVSLCPSLTELVFGLGRGDSLVGRTKFCVHPASGLAGVETVGGTKNPKIDRIVALAPNLVLMNEEENRREDAEALHAAGISCHVSFPRDVQGTAEMVRSIGTALGAISEAEAIAGEIERRARRVREAAAARAPVRYAYLIWRRPWMSINDETFIAAMLSLAGGVNVFGGWGDRYPAIEADDLAAADPQLVLLSSEPFPFSQTHADELAEATGLPRERFRLADGELLSWHGSRTPAGIDYSERILLDPLRS
jgi:iron complex transport system substrate-binding protein